MKKFTLLNFNQQKKPTKISRLFSDYYIDFYAFNLLEKSIRIGVATHSDEYVPITTPTNNANKKPLIAGPPKMNIIKTTTNKIMDVLNVRLNVVFKDLLMIS